MQSAHCAQSHRQPLPPPTHHPLAPASQVLQLRESGAVAPAGGDGPCQLVVGQAEVAYVQAGPLAGQAACRQRNTRVKGEQRGGSSGKGAGGID